MFDTSLVRTRAAAAPHRAALLTVSVGIHSAAIIAALAMSIASSGFPNRAPNQVEIYRPTMFPVAPPPPLGTQPKAQQPEAPKPQPKEIVTPPQQVTAPPDIPQDTPQLEAPAGAGESPATGEGSIGVPWGDKDGVDVGQDFGTRDGTGTQEVPFQPGTGGVTFARVLTRVQPQFPQSMIRAIRSATVIVTCVIDKEGKIRDPKIIMSSYPPFNQAVLDALNQWTFAPGTLHGKPVDTYFELKVRFEVR